MKFLKTYEESNSKRYKTYVVLEGDSQIDGDYMLWCYKIEDEYVDDDLIIVFPIFKYKNNEIKYINNQSVTATVDEIDNEVIYQSDDLNEIKDKLPELLNMKKYNL